MATQSPFSLLEGLLQNLPFADLPPPMWVVDEVQRRVVLLLNHILLQEPQATARLARQKGRVVLLQWRSFSMRLVATAAGLLDLAPPDAQADLVLAVSEESPLALAQEVLRGERPAVRIAGDVQLAAEVNWLVDHVRWDIEEDLARVLGDAQAHTLGQAARGMASALRQFMQATSTTGTEKATK
ncbi:MAG: hypothetical protein WCJ76_05100 [Comamonadaceae bacterium]